MTLDFRQSVQNLFDSMILPDSSDVDAIYGWHRMAVRHEVLAVLDRIEQAAEGHQEYESFYEMESAIKAIRKELTKHHD